MAMISVNDSELQLLIDILEREVPNLREEVRHTDDFAYREFLKEREHCVQSLLRTLTAQVAGTSGSQVTK